MFGPKHYVPILTGKMGEYRALQKLDAGTKSSLTPIIEVPPSDWDFEADAPTKTIDELVAPVADNIEKHWATDEIYVDTYPVEDEGTTAAGKLPLTHILDDGRTRGLKLTPVTGLGKDPPHHLAVAGAAKQDGRGACLRLLLNEINSSPNLAAEISALLTTIGLSVKQVDLVVDLGAVDVKLEPSFNAVLLTPSRFQYQCL